MSKTYKKIKPKKKRAPNIKRHRIRRFWSYSKLLPANLIFWLRSRKALRQAPLPYQPHEISDDFFGINVAPGETPEHDDYILARLKELGLKSVRIDYGYGEDSCTHAARLIDRLHSEGYSVLLHLVPPRDEAIYFGRIDYDQKWRLFVQGALEHFAGKISAVEIGSTINRFSWSGYTKTSYVRSAKLAARICQEHDIPWYGPNVTDYSPLTNIGVLGLLRRAKILPDCHTNNLFVDRAGQPENYDPKVGFGLSRRMNKNFINKSRWLVAIGLHFGVPRTISTYAYWTLSSKKDSKIRYVGEEQYARYLARYFTLAASAGLLNQVYWGQMISSYKGLIDDGCNYAPQVPAPHHTWKLLGQPEDYVTRPAFKAFAALVRNLIEARFCRRIPTFGGTFLFEFTRSAPNDDTKEERLIIGWTRDGMQDDLESYFSGKLAGIVRTETLDGTEPEGKLPPLSSSPIYITYQGEPWKPVEAVEFGNYLSQMYIPQMNDAGFTWQNFRVGRFRGLIRSDLFTKDMKEKLADPMTMFNMDNVRQIKDGKRRRLADIPFPVPSNDSESTGRAILKRFIPRKIGVDLFRSRAARSWDNSAKLITANVKTPQPYILIEDAEEPARHPSYLISEKIENALEVREMLKAYRNRKPAPIDVPRETFLRQLGFLIRHMHRNGIYHRDLSGGNILVGQELIQATDGPEVELTVIDTDRVRFPTRFGWFRKHLDLARVRHAPEDRRSFYYAYHNCRIRSMKRYWRQYRLIYILYRIKFNLKKPRRMIREFKRSLKRRSRARRK